MHHSGLPSVAGEVGVTRRVCCSGTQRGCGISSWTHDSVPSPPSSTMPHFSASFNNRLKLKGVSPCRRSGWSCLSFAPNSLKR